MNDSFGIRPVPALLCIITVLLAVVLLLSMKAFAGPAPGPHFSTTSTATAADFTVPSGSGATYTLRLYSQGQLLGQTTGTSGTLSVPVPTTSCGLQADVRKSQANGKTFSFSGNRGTTICCPPAAAAASTASAPTAAAPVASARSHRRASSR
ncbi:MAG: hypothetical protein ACRDY1_08695 [Acidimicrobiales bacterium]